MACRKCEDCKIRYPYNHGGVCEVCDNPTKYDAIHQAHADFNVRVRKLKEARADFELPIPKIAVGVVRDEAGRYWIHDIDLLRVGWRRALETDEILEVLDVEGNDILIEVQGADVGHARWWVAPWIDCVAIPSPTL